MHGIGAVAPDRATEFHARITTLLKGLPRPDGASPPVEIDGETSRNWKLWDIFSGIPSTTEARAAAGIHVHTFFTFAQI